MMSHERAIDLTRDLIHLCEVELMNATGAEFERLKRERAELLEIEQAEAAAQAKREEETGR